ncbi:MAG: ribonuclease J [Desulfovibrionaceae bacterium]|nr:ribonuclease J [Desulfovibrionaceae bacterium]
MPQRSEDFLTITPLGGLGEIGLNCQLWETPQGVVMVDCGLMFPDDSHLGVDVVIPSLDSVLAVRERFLGVVLTHGHEDHIGALPWLIPHLKGVRVHGSAFTLALVDHKLKERGLQDHAELIPVTADTVLTLGDLHFRFFPVCHSIPEGFALGVQSPVGAILHSGDFKIDPEPLFGSGTDMRLFRDFAGERGVRLLLSDSTNVEREGRTLSERRIMEELGKVFAVAPGRIVITLFSSHIHRIQEVFDLAGQYGRSVVISGKSLANNIEKASELGLLHVPSAFFNAYHAVPDLPDKELVLLVTGAQGEPLSALARMVQGEHRQLAIKRGDTVIMSSRVIPGNARAITRLINDMYRLGAEVYHEKVHDIHASGHACREELRAMIEAARPRIFVPIHGEYRHLIMHSRLAQECGVPPECAVILENGEALTLLPTGIRREERVSVEYTLVDGKGVGDVGTLVLKERHILGGEGMVLVVLVRDMESGDVLHGPQMISKGFVFHQHFDHLLEDAKCLVLDQLEENRNAGPEKLGEGIRASLRRFFRRILDRDPVIMPIITDV